jgi:enoyl-CoA hydratase/carnithine racemase
VSDRVTFEVGDDRVGVVTLNRPDKLNALDRGAFEGLHDAGARTRAAIEDGAVKAVLLRGEGRAFSSGLDISLFGESLSSGKGFDDEGIAWLQQAFTVWEDLPVPTVAAVRGVALGGGCQLAAACHLRIAAPDASFGVLEARWGLVPDLGGTYRLPRLVGLSRAVDLAVSTRRIDASTALAWGLVDAILDEADFDGAARGYAALLAQGPTLATGQVARLCRENLSRPREEALAAERAAQAACLSSSDFQEAVAAAMESRAPHFLGR